MKYFIIRGNFFQGIFLKGDYEMENLKIEQVLTSLEMAEETKSQVYTSCKVIEMVKFGRKKKDKLENWLKEQIHKKYGDKDEITIKNPLIRLSTKFEALSDSAQCELYEIAKRAPFGNKGRMSMSKEFWNFLEMQPVAWEDIEEVADRFLLKEEVYKQTVGGDVDE